MGLEWKNIWLRIFLDLELMEINKLVDLNNLRTAPELTIRQEKKLLEELEANIFNADWITIGIMAPSDNRAVKALQSISKKYPSIKFGNIGCLLYTSPSPRDQLTSRMPSSA